MNTGSTRLTTALLVSLLLLSACHKKPVVVRQPVSPLDQAKLEFQANRLARAAEILEEYVSQELDGSKREEATYLLIACYSMPDSPSFNPSRVRDLVNGLPSDAPLNSSAAISRALPQLFGRLDALKAEISSAEEEQRRLEQEIAGCRQEIEDQRAGLARAESEKQTLADSVNRRRDRINELTRRLQSAEARNVKLQGEIDAMKKLLEDMKKIDIGKRH